MSFLFLHNVLFLQLMCSFIVQIADFVDGNVDFEGFQVCLFISLSLF